MRCWVSARRTVIEDIEFEEFEEEGAEGDTLVVARMRAAKLLIFAALSAGLSAQGALV